MSLRARRYARMNVSVAAASASTKPARSGRSGRISRPVYFRNSFSKSPVHVGIVPSQLTL